MFVGSPGEGRRQFACCSPGRRWPEKAAQKGKKRRSRPNIEPEFDPTRSSTKEGRASPRWTRAIQTSFPRPFPPHHYLARTRVPTWSGIRVARAGSIAKTGAEEVTLAKPSRKTNEEAEKQQSLASRLLERRAVIGYARPA